MRIQLSSFGFKYGFFQADLLWDVRFLPNPFWDPELRPYSGKEETVARYALGNETGNCFLDLLEPLLLFLIKEYVAQGRELLVLAVGCTGGRHRSVAVVEHLRAVLEAIGFQPEIGHRDIDKV